MKYIIVFLLILSFIGSSVNDEKSFGSIFKDAFYNYITSLDNTFNYLATNVLFFENLSQIPYKKAYNDVMENRHLVKHLVISGETLDDIIKTYNSNITDMESFRKVIYKENEGVISDTYEVMAGQYITVPSD